MHQRKQMLWAVTHTDFSQFVHLTALIEGGLSQYQQSINIVIRLCLYSTTIMF